MKKIIITTFIISFFLMAINLFATEPQFFVFNCGNGGPLITAQADLPENPTDEEILKEYDRLEAIHCGK